MLINLEMCWYLSSFFCWNSYLLNKDIDASVSINFETWVLVLLLKGLKSALKLF